MHSLKKNRGDGLTNPKLCGRLCKVKHFSGTTMLVNFVYAKFTMGSKSVSSGDKKQRSAKCTPLFFMVRETGLEPVRWKHTPLKRARLPIPPLPQKPLYYTSFFCGCQYLLEKFFCKFCVFSLSFVLSDTLYCKTNI